MTFVEGKSTYKIPKEFGTLIPFLPSADIWEADKPTVNLPFSPSKIDFSKIQIRKIGNNEVELLTTYRMAYLSEMQGERSVEYQQQLKKEQ